MEISVKVAVRVCPPTLNRKPLGYQYNVQESKPDDKQYNKPSVAVADKQQSLQDNNSGPEQQNPLRLEERKDDGENLKRAPESLGAKPKHPIIPDNEQGLKCCVQPIKSPIAAPPGVPPELVQVGPHTFPVTCALPVNCSQNHVYNEAVLPMMTLFMEGFDVSVITYGQRACGKTYSLYGKGFDEVVSEADHGIVAHCVREIFTHIGHHPERTYTVNITWVEVCRDIIKDLFGVGSVQCMRMSDVFHWLQVGYNLLHNSNLRMGHSLFSLTLEQRWISREGLIQHRLSTASFTDLGPTERVFLQNFPEQPRGLTKDLCLQSLEYVVNVLIDPSLMARLNGIVPYNQTALSAMLKDSFGGRAQTLLMVCVSPFERDVEETLWNMQFAFKVQMVRNIVVINSYSDDNTPVPLDAITPEAKEHEHENEEEVNDNFALQFAAKQWANLVSSAEELLTKLVSCDVLPDQEKLHINNWLLKKQEYEECLKSTESNGKKVNLSIIREDEELEGAVGGAAEEEHDEEMDSHCSEADTALQVNSEQESDNESDKSDIDEHLEYLMENLKTKTDNIIFKQYQDFMLTHPKGLMESMEEKPSCIKKPKLELMESEEEERRVSSASLRRADGRRRSLIPGSTLSSSDLAKLNRLAIRDSKEKDQSLPSLDNDDIFNVPLETKSLRPSKNSRLEGVRKKLRKLDTDIEAKLKQIKEIEETMDLKQNIISDLMKNNESSSAAKQKLRKKRGKLEAEYEKTKKSFQKSLAQGGRRDRAELERLKENITRLEQRLNDVKSLKDIAGETTHKVKKLQQSLMESKKLIGGLQKKVKREGKLKETLKNELMNLSEKENCKTLLKHTKKKEEKTRNLKEVQSRILNLDQVLKEKTENLQTHQDHKQREVLRFEIRNLRKTRDLLLDQRCSLDRKLKREKYLSLKEERKLLECEEAIEAIDAAIEFKNELICGNKSIDTKESLQSEKGARMLMERLNNLSSEEMRTLLYKYFIKVIDLRDSSYKLEKQLNQMEREKDAWEWKERVLSNAIRQARLEGERNAVRLQKQHEMKLTLMLRHMAEDSCNSSGGSLVERSLALAYYNKETTLNSTAAQGDTSFSTTTTDREYEWPHCEKKKLVRNSKLDAVVCPPAESHSKALAKYKPCEKLKEKPKDTKSNFFAKFHLLTRNTSSGSGSGSGSSSNSPTEDFPMPTINMAKRKSNELQRSKENEEQNTGKKMVVIAPLTETNVKKLSNDSKRTKVTRQRNKLVIQDKTRRQEI